MNRILDAIHSPQDLKTLSRPELLRLSQEIRAQLLAYLSAHGGHVGSNLATVELTLALHTVFDSPTDKIVFDVSHQCYTHKLLTGRKAAYTDPAQYGSVTGFTSPRESEHDIFSIGHTSTAVSLAGGLAKARDLKGESYNVIAVVGDGALSGGEAFEGLNTAAAQGGNFIVVVNDNDMSIAENHGGLYGNLRLLRETGGKAGCNLFKALGFDYRFIPDGNDLEQVLDVLASLKGIDHPVVVHTCTVKGKGYAPAEHDRENWHFSGPFDVGTGQPLHQPEPVETYENLTRDYLAAHMEKDPSLVAITAGTPKIFGFDAGLRKRFAKQFVDVGIAEPHAVAMASGIAKNSGRPIFGVSSSFLQRTYDQLSSDLALNHSPAVILVCFGGISGGSQTHMGVFDIPLVMNIPNMVCLAPTCKEEYLHMLAWALEQTESPVAIRTPGVATVSRQTVLPETYSGPVKYETVKRGSGVAILALGKFFQLGEEVCARLAAETGIQATLINPRFITGFDAETLDGLKENHQVVITLEDGVIDGGFGEKIARYYGDSAMRVLNFGARREFIEGLSTDELYRRYHLTAGQIVEDVPLMEAK